MSDERKPQKRITIRRLSEAADLIRAVLAASERNSCGPLCRLHKKELEAAAYVLDDAAHYRKCLHIG